MEASFKLPVSSYEEIIKLIKTYGHGKVGVSVTLDELVKTSGISKFIISKNNGFLMQMGLITKGSKKSPSETCKHLATAYNMNMQDQIKSIWKGIFDKDDFIGKMVSTISVKGKMQKDDFVKHIVFSANCGNSSAYKTGAVTVIEILKLIGSIAENDGYITIGDSEIRTPALMKKEIQDSPQAFVSTEEKTSDIRETEYYVQQYTCESGEIAKFIIPENATEDDLLGFRDMLEIALKRKFKLEV